MLEREILLRIGEAGVVFNASCPTSDEGFQEATTLVDAAEVAADVPEHQVALVVQQNARVAPRDGKHGVTLKKTEAVAVEGRSADIVDARNLQLRHLVPQVGGRYPRERQKQDACTWYACFQ